MDWIAIFGTAACVFLLGWVCRSMLERVEMDELRAKNDVLRAKISEMSKRGVQNAEDEAFRHHAVEIEKAELQSRLKAADIIADGWRKAAERGRA